MEINSIIIDFTANFFKTVILPESKILDVIFCENYHKLKIIYQYNSEPRQECHRGPRSFNIHIVNDGMLSCYHNLNKNCKYLKHICIPNTIVDLNTASLGKIYPNWVNYEYYVFIEKVKTIPEVRDDKINSIICGE